MKLPTPSRFSISELAKDWKKNEEDILDMAAAGHLELRVLVAGPFMIDNVEHHNFDFIIDDSDFIRVIAATDDYSPKRLTAEKTAEGMLYHVFDWSLDYVPTPNTCTIERKDLYVPLSSVQKVTGQSQHRLILESAQAWLNRHEDHRSEKFCEWLNGEYQTISKNVAKAIYTFLTTDHPVS